MSVGEYIDFASILTDELNAKETKRGSEVA